MGTKIFFVVLFAVLTTFCNSLDTIVKLERYVMANPGYANSVIPTIEDIIADSILRSSCNKRFSIQGINISSESSIKGKFCLFGDNAVLWKDTKQCKHSQLNYDGTGNDVDSVYLPEPGSTSCITSGTNKISLDANNSSINTSSVYMAGAIWRHFPNLYQEGQLDAKYGVEIFDKTRIGGIYNGDGNVLIEFCLVDGNWVYMPGATNGSIVRFMGQVNIGGYQFTSSPSYLFPLTFMFSKTCGFVYVRGKGKIIYPSGKAIELP